MILIHGECGSGKTAALRALEAAPPPGFRAVYVPVPTLDFTGMARWCLDRLHIAPGADPVAKLRESLRQTRVALLIDDAESMPLDAALAVRQLERDGRGGALVVAACASDQRETPALAALGVPAREIAVEVGGSAAAAAQVLAALGGARASHARGSARSASARLGAAVSVPGVPLGAAAAAAAPTVELATGAAPAPAAPIFRAPALAAVSAPERDPREAFASPAQAIRSRSIPLWLAAAMAATAFMLPVAFIAGYFLGARPTSDPAALASATTGAELPAVSAPPVLEVGEPAAAAPTEIAAARAPLAPARESARATKPRAESRAAAAPQPESARVARSRSELPAQPRRKEPASSTVRASKPKETRSVRPSEPAPARASREEEDWGTPALISVEAAAGPSGP